MAKLPPSVIRTFAEMPDEYDPENRVRGLDNCKEPWAVLFTDGHGNLVGGRELTDEEAAAAQAKFYGKRKPSETQKRLAAVQEQAAKHRRSRDG